MTGMQIINMVHIPGKIGRPHLLLWLIGALIFATWAM